MATQYSILPWVRQGLVSDIEVPDGAGLNSHATFPIDLNITTTSGGDTETSGPPIPINLRLYGPGDIVGIDRRQIIRTDPQPQAQHFLPNHLVAIEFDRPDFPWLFTPAKAEAQQGRLRPWLCLVVVRQHAGVSLSTQSGCPLPVLTLQSQELARQELPDLSESWAWVHSQVLHDEASNGDHTNLKNALQNQPHVTLSRLLCPRRLEANTHYYACLVPAFEVGRKAGLNIPLTEQDETLEPAWDFPEPAGEEQSFELPVYYHWEFGTAQAGDFKTLAKKLTPQVYEDIGSRRLYIGQAGVPDWEDMGSVDLEGVFRSTNSSPPEDLSEQPWASRLESVLRSPSESTNSSDPTVAPPIYAHFHQSLQQLPSESPPNQLPQNHWIRELNLDVRNRVAAGLGVFLVQKLQEELMHSAWQQLGNIQQAQQLKWQRELGQTVNEALYQKHFDPLKPDETLLYQMTAPVHSRVLTANQAQTIRGWAVNQDLPPTGTIATFRKLSRPGGPTAKRMQTQPSLNQPIDIKLAQTGQKTPITFTSGQAPPLKPFDKIRLDMIGQRYLWAARPTTGTNAVDDAALGRMNTALTQLEQYINTIVAASPPPEDVILTPSSSSQNVQLKASLNPNLGQNDSSLPIDFFSIQSTTSSVEAPAAPLPIPHPTFPQAMYKVLREFAPDAILPGSDRIADNTVTILGTNPGWIEAVMLGLNHEMARELLWRNYPTDQRGTYFQNFWSYNTADIGKIHEWPTTARLGEILKGSSNQLVLIIRAELLRQFPDTVIYAVKAESQTELSIDQDDQKYPLHRGQITNDVSFLLFDLDEAEAISHPGWFFIFQQQPTEAQFNLDATQTGNLPPLANWEKLDWGHTGIQLGAYLSIAQARAQLEQLEEFPPPGAIWGFNSAHMAEILLQKPFKIGIHASLLLPATV